LNRAGYALARQDFSDFIRRLPIIIIEDSILHPHFPFLIWLMVAQSRPGFHPCGAHLGMCLRILWEIAAIPWKDTLEISLEDSNETKKIWETTEPESLWRNLGMFEKSLIKSILIRGAYGGRKFFFYSKLRLCSLYPGMGGDIQMLKKAAILWSLRFQGKAGSVPFENIWDINRKKNYETTGTEAEANNFSPWAEFLLKIYSSVKSNFDWFDVGPMNADDVCLSAIDFHCSSIVQTTKKKIKLENFLFVG
jgi:hypothetical protein